VSRYSVPDFRFMPELGSRFPPGLEGAYGRLKIIRLSKSRKSLLAHLSISILDQADNPCRLATFTTVQSRVRFLSMSGYARRDILTDSEITAFYSRFTILIVSRYRGEYAVTHAP
jgi:hypothetical protein